MAILDLFSKRQRALRGEMPDVYTYDKIPGALRVQVCHILIDALGDGSPYSGRSEEAYKTVVEALCREYGCFVLPPATRRHELHQELFDFILSEADVERVLDAVEISFRLVDNASRDYDFLHVSNASERADAAILELNGRFREHGVGFEFSDGQLIRIDSEFIHAEVVKPALRLLAGKKYAGARQEFLNAHENYRSGKTKECLNDCLKSFESTMKAICDSRRWVYKPTATAKDLISTCLDNELIPVFWQTHFASLRQGLECGVPTGRNKLGGHGQGTDPVVVPSHLAAYMLHMTAAAIVFLAEADAALKPRV